MKLTLEKEEIQLLGQLVLEIERGNYNPSMLLNAILLHEFKTENAGIFAQPERIKRKVRFSTLVAIRIYVKLQHRRGDTWWDMTLIGLQNKLDRMSAEPKKPTETLLMLQ